MKSLILKVIVFGILTSYPTPSHAIHGDESNITEDELRGESKISQEQEKEIATPSPIKSTEMHSFCRNINNLFRLCSGTKLSPFLSFSFASSILAQHTSLTSTQFDRDLEHTLGVTYSGLFDLAVVAFGSEKTEKSGATEAASKTLPRLARNYNIDVPEAAALLAYTLDSEKLNRIARSNGTSEVINVIDQALSKLPMLNPETKVFRGTSIDWVKFNQILASGVLIDSGFMSTTPAEEVAHGFVRHTPGEVPVLIEVIEPKTGKNISAFSSYPEQREVLFRRNSSFRLIKNEIMQDGTHRLVVSQDP